MEVRAEQLTGNYFVEKYTNQSSIKIFVLNNFNCCIAQQRIVTSPLSQKIEI